MNKNASLFDLTVLAAVIFSCLFFNNFRVSNLEQRIKVLEQSMKGR